MLAPDFKEAKTRRRWWSSDPTKPGVGTQRAKTGEEAWEMPSTGRREVPKREPLENRRRTTPRDEYYHYCTLLHWGSQGSCQECFDYYFTPLIFLALPTKPMAYDGQVIDRASSHVQSIEVQATTYTKGVFPPWRRLHTSAYVTVRNRSKIDRACCTTLRYEVSVDFRVQYKLTCTRLTPSYSASFARLWPTP